MLGLLPLSPATPPSPPPATRSPPLFSPPATVFDVAPLTLGLGDFVLTVVVAFESTVVARPLGRGDFDFTVAVALESVVVATPLGLGDFDLTIAVVFEPFLAAAPAAAGALFALGGNLTTGVRRSAAFGGWRRRSVGFIAHADCPTFLPLLLLLFGVVVVVARCLRGVVAAMGRFLRGVLLAAVGFFWGVAGLAVAVVFPVGGGN